MSTTIPPLAPAAAGRFTRFTYHLARRRFGEVPEPMAVAAHHRGLLWLWIGHELALERACRKAPKELTQLAVYRTAWTIGCSWWIDFGTMLQRLDGLDIDRLRRIDEFETAEEFSETERLALRLADAMTATPPRGSSDVVDDLTARIGTEAVLELVYEISHENQRSRMNHALGVTDQGFSTSSCRVPWAADAA